MTLRTPHERYRVDDNQPLSLVLVRGKELEHFSHYMI